jgi:hypothetical protein
MPSATIDGREVVVSEKEPSITQPGPVVTVSKRQVRERVAKLERYAATKGPKQAYYKAQLKAWQQLMPKEG